MKQLISTNPAKNYEPLGSVSVSSPKEVRDKVGYANNARQKWKELGVVKRVKLLEPLYRLVKQKKETIAQLATKEIGKPITESRSDIDWDLSYLRWFLDNGALSLADDTTHKTQDGVHKIIFEPLGVAAVIVPWNYPFSNFLWGAIPNLIAGNTVVFKHSEECPLSGKLYEDFMEKLDLPGGVFSEIYGDGGVGEDLIHQDINLIWFTGSSAVGRKLYEIAGKKMIKCLLEMGGSNPAVIFADANIDNIVPKLVTKRFMNCGQTCDALKRIIVHRSKYAELVEKLKARVEQFIVGDPENEKTEMGSLVAKRQLTLLQEQVADAVKRGARVVTGGKEPHGLSGAYYLPTILTNIKRTMRVWREETFGPVLPIVVFDKEAEAVSLADDTPYGLGAQIYTTDKKIALRVAAQLQAGTIDINDASHWLPCNPFGGYKESGMGREHGKIGFQELCQIKVLAY